MKDYIAWVSYEGDQAHAMSIYRGTLKACQSKALEIHQSENWKQWAEGRNTYVKITNGKTQRFADAYILNV